MDSFPNEPMAFRGILWGQRLDSLTGRIFLRISEEGDISSFHLQDDPLRIGDVAVSDIVYSFFRHRFYRASVLIDSYEDFSRIKESFSDSYGEGVSLSREDTETYYWSGAELDLSLEYSESAGGRIEYSFRPIHKQEEKNAKLKAAHDWDKD
jgi:hypothetical protein